MQDEKVLGPTCCRATPQEPWKNNSDLGGFGSKVGPFGLQEEKGFPSALCHLSRQGAASQGAALTPCDMGVEFTNCTGTACTVRAVPPADLLLITLIGKPVFRKVQARDHPLPCTVISIQGTCGVAPCQSHAD